MTRRELKAPSPQRAKKRLSRHLEQVNLYSAGIDIGAHEHYVAVPEDLDDGSAVRMFACFTADLERMADWLAKNGRPPGSAGEAAAV